MEVLATDTDRRRTSSSLLTTVVLLGLPSIVAFCASRTFFSDPSHFAASGLWFMYQTSVFVAYLGIAISAILMVAAAVRKKASVRCIAWMTIAIIGSGAFLYVATHFGTISQ